MKTSSLLYSISIYRLLLALTLDGYLQKGPQCLLIFRDYMVSPQFFGSLGENNPLVFICVFSSGALSQHQSGAREDFMNIYTTV